MNKSYIVYSDSRLRPDFDRVISNFGRKYGGKEALPPTPALRDDGVRIHEIPHGIFIIRRNAYDTEAKRDAVRYDVLGGNYSDEDRARFASLCTQLNSLSYSQGH